MRPSTVTRTLPTLPIGSDEYGVVPSNVHGCDAYPPEKSARVPPVTTAATSTNEDLPGLEIFLEQTEVIPVGESF